MQLRAEREAALNRLRQQLEAAQRAERESVKQLLEVQLRAEQGICQMRADRDASLQHVGTLQARVSEAVQERDAAWAHGKADRDLLDRALRRTHGLLQQAQQEKEEGLVCRFRFGALDPLAGRSAYCLRKPTASATIRSPSATYTCALPTSEQYLARMDKQLLAEELRMRHDEATAALQQRAEERRGLDLREEQATQARLAAAAYEKGLAAELAAANATAAAAQASRPHSHDPTQTDSPSRHP
tara:strand:+ start:218 stop:946 length:729 start_codon:yes stop_codon:yes gene_type:complete